MDISYGSFTGLLALNFALIDIGLKIIALIIIPNNRKPSSATAWLLAIFFIPLIGLPLFFLLGNSVLSKPRTKQQNEITKHFQGIFNDMNDNYMSLRIIWHTLEWAFAMDILLKRRVRSSAPIAMPSLKKYIISNQKYND
jgi:hypothetical protein